MVLFSMAALGLPGMSGFVSEFMVFVGAFTAINKVLVGISVLGVVLGATYMLRMVQNVFLGEFDKSRWDGLTEINLREIISVAPLAVLTVAIGVYPKPLADLMAATLEHLITLMAR
jgi:NADH-quinone oxidoreductase subunit M